ncbi:hypothetical protein GMRT_14130 [Giardia muris]|uniref:Uncharacterized protein n=1 Tax=Giardia muris TaxID=5742 RepID=A0A4Z1SRI3_GIAMU|nr:hypothetical protein GMRT_14130 [Giardia muris]|eukprot:TNJ28340.1 hypothetical protein GMRT_14130 [Giardia muris]
MSSHSLSARISPYVPTASIPSSPTFRIVHGEPKPTLSVNVSKLVTKERFTNAMRELSNIFLDALAKSQERIEKQQRKLETHLKRMNDELLMLRKLYLKEERDGTTMRQKEMGETIKALERRLETLENERATTSRRCDIGIESGEIKRLRKDLSDVKRSIIGLEQQILDAATNFQHDSLKFINDQEVIREEVRLLAKAMVKLQESEVRAHESLDRDYAAFRGSINQRIDELSALVNDALVRLGR